MPAQDDATVLFLFMAFGSLVVLLLILVAVGIQTWLLWKIARAIVEGKIVEVESESVVRATGKMNGDDAAVERRMSAVQEEERRRA
jgi:type IV secretory pathway TrbF-like protein